VAKVGLAEIAQLAEIVAAVAVIVSLIYVGRERASNTAAMRGQHPTDGHAHPRRHSSAAGRRLDRQPYQVPRRPRSVPCSVTSKPVGTFCYFVRRGLTCQNVFFQCDLDLIEPRA
jgi:hypothetical protein